MASSPVTVTEDLSRVTFIHTDGLGSPVARTDGAGTVLSRTRYEPYGYVAAGATPTIGFTGHVNDADTGLTYMQQRYYDPVAGRFLSVDPVTATTDNGSNFNRYSYANNSPYKYIDPDGRLPVLLLIPIALKFVDAALTAEEVYSAVETGGIPAAGAVALGGIAGSVVPSGKIADRVYKYVAGGRFSKRVKKIAAERAKNKCEYCTNETQPAKQSERGITPPRNEGVTDHVEPDQKVEIIHLKMLRMRAVTVMNG